MQTRQAEITALQGGVSSINSALTLPYIDWSASFVLGASVTPPTKGASVYTADYRRLGGWVDFAWSVTIGAGFSAGSGTYQVPVPVTPIGNKRQVGTVYVQDAGTALITGVSFFNGADTWLSLLLANNTGAVLGSGGPGTAWTPGDLIQGSITYLAAI